ncbi:phosphorylase family protein [Cardiosporidium cionae]|uniref:Phosphorylase family protein n=1 Tax=Cardiosporidium cionae TaxID=476202 RepID=A0ABQ7J4K5_9APIC|nr:phosphorylase family protein [Cardiosporidium cionae]|eukprot:KAF8817930.1 phosphorylase family protein [Cardiosporidium cionae]
MEGTTCTFLKISHHTDLSVSGYTTFSDTAIKAMARQGMQSFGKDILWAPDGSIYHLGAKKGEINNRLITVGDHGRANTLAELLDKDTPTFSILSSRLFRIHSGCYKGVPVSIVGIGMGAPMMDFFVRETSYLIEGPMAVIRLGSCGLSNPSLAPGTVVTCTKGSMYCYTNYGYFDGFATEESTEATKPYVVTKAVPSDPELTKLLVKALKDRNVPYHEGLNIACETFYSCQGRDDGVYQDENAYLLDLFQKLGIDSVEMETHGLFNLAKRCKYPILASGCAVGIVNRTNPNITSNVSAEMFHQNILNAGKSCLDALAGIVLPNEK